MTAKRYQDEHRRFLEENNPEVLNALRQSGDLTSYLSSVGETADQMFESLMGRHSTDPKVQSLPYHDRVRELQSYRHEAEEQVRHDVICQPVRDED